MDKLHLFTGLSVMIVFLLTGQCMDFHNPKMDELDEGARMMYRSRHVYILLSGLINLSIGVYFIHRQHRWQRVFQQTGSILILVAPLFLTAAFIREPGAGGLDSTLTMPAVTMLFGGTLCHLLAHQTNKKFKENSNGSN